MKTLVCLIVLAIPLLAQDAPTPHHDLTVKEIVEILADFDFKHVEQQPFFPPAFGVTDFSANPPSVWIFHTGDTTTRRCTVIHELLHVYYHQRNQNPPEEFIGYEEQRICSQMFEQ